MVRTSASTRAQKACSENKSGADCSGSSGAANRTLTLAKANVSSTGLVVTVNGTTLHEGSRRDFTISANIITFLNAIDNGDNIRVVYFV